MLSLALTNDTCLCCLQRLKPGTHGPVDLSRLYKIWCERNTCVIVVSASYSGSGELFNYLDRVKVNIIVTL